MELGKVTREADGYQVQFDRVYPHPVQKVWEALTKPENLKIWFTDIEMDFRPGGKMTFRFRDEARMASYGKVMEIDPPRRFVFSWEGELAKWELSDAPGNTCRLKLTYSKLPQDFAAKAPAGFHTLLDRLEDVLAGRKEPWAFGTEDTGQQKLVMRYGAAVHREHPEIEELRPVIVEKLCNASPDGVWQALTRKEQMKEWYFDLDDFKAEVGFEFTFPGKGQKGEEYIHRCRITEVTPSKKLQYSWQYENHPGYSEVTFELFPEGATKTRVRVTHQGLETFSQSNPDFARKSFTGGWTELITVLLPKYIESGS